MSRRGGERRRMLTAAMAVCVLVVVTVAAGCSAVNRVALVSDDAGRVSVENCGIWIIGVVVVDPGTGAVEWSTRATPGPEDAGWDTVGEVVLGQAPDGWTTTGTAPLPGESVRLVVETADGAAVTLDPPPLEPGDVYYDGRLQSEDFTRTCGTFYPYESWLSGAAIAGPVVAVLATGLALVLLITRGRRHRVGDSPKAPVDAPAECGGPLASGRSPRRLIRVLQRWDRQSRSSTFTPWSGLDAFAPSSWFGMSTSMQSPASSRPASSSVTGKQPARSVWSRSSGWRHALPSPTDWTVAVVRESLLSHPPHIELHRTRRSTARPHRICRSSRSSSSPAGWPG